jgi:cytochrome c-type biogenesis protein CcmH
MKYLALIAALMATPVFAVEPDEILSDPALEARARDLSRGLRCLVCRNESIDESNADLARDLRILVRERLVAGDTNDEVIDWVVGVYGEYVLLRPTLTGSNIVLWLAGPLGILVALGGGLIYVRRRGATAAQDVLTEDEEKRLLELLKE